MNISNRSLKKKIITSNVCKFFAKQNLLNKMYLYYKQIYEMYVYVYIYTVDTFPSLYRFWINTINYKVLQIGFFYY